MAETLPELTKSHLDEIDYWKENITDSGDLHHPIFYARNWRFERLNQVDCFNIDPLDHSYSADCLPRERERFKRISDWIDIQHGGDVDSAFAESPPLAVRLPDGSLDLIDGWHRLTTAAARNFTNVLVLVGEVTMTQQEMGHQAAMLRVLHDLVDTINATGGLVKNYNGFLAPAADEEWSDLADVYLDACKVLDRKPMTRGETDGD